jgi:hypothetical protein
LRGIQDADSVDVIDNVRNYLAAVSAAAGVGLESCSWGSERPEWGYIALDWQVDGRDVALLWDARAGWSLVTEEATDVHLMAHLDGEVTAEPATVAAFAAALRAETVWAGPALPV